MKFTKCFLSVAVLAIFTAISCGPALAASYKDLVPQEIKSSGILRIGSQQTYPPIEFRDPQTKEMVGLSVELLTEVANRLDLKIEWIQSDYGALITGAKASRFDIASGGISDQPEREKELDFVNYMLVGTGILCLNDEAPKYHTISDFSGKKVAFTLGSKKIEAAVKEASDALVADGKPAIGMITLPNPSDAKMQLDLKRVDGYLNETCTLAYLMKQDPGKYRMVEDGNYLLTPLVTSWGFTKENTGLRDAVQQVLQEMLNDGTYEKIMSAWDLKGGMLPEITINMPWDKRQ